MTARSRTGNGNATRRAFLRLAGAIGAGATASSLVPSTGVASESSQRSAVAGRISPPIVSPAEFQAAIHQVTGGAKITPGRVKLKLPPIVENGNSVQCTVTVASPMTPADYVKSIHIFTERNPQPNVIGVRLGLRSGIARFSARIRLADTQKVTAIAALSDGTFWSDRAEIVVTSGACLEDT